MGKSAAAKGEFLPAELMIYTANQCQLMSGLNQLLVSFLPYPLLFLVLTFAILSSVISSMG